VGTAFAAIIRGFPRPKKLAFRATIAAFHPYQEIQERP